MPFKAPAPAEDVPYWTKVFEPDSVLVVVGYESQPERKGNHRAYLTAYPASQPERAQKVCILGALAKQFHENAEAGDLDLPLRVRFSTMATRSSGRSAWGAFPADQEDADAA